MAVEFSLLSGATINNELRLMYELLRSGECYLGFNRQHETWGQGTLIRYSKASGQEWPNGVIGDIGGIFDDQHRFLNISSAGTTAIHMARFEYADGESDYPVDVTDRLVWLTDDANGGIVNGVDYLECIFINDKWINIRGIDPTYEFSLYDDTQQKSYKYFIFNYAKDINNLLEVDIIREFEHPGLSTRVQLKYASHGVTNATVADIAPGCSDLERRVNINGEYHITGIGAEFIDWLENTNTAKNSAFFLIDKDGALLVDSIEYDETIITEHGQPEFIFKYQVSEHITNDPNSSLTAERNVRFKITTADNINNRFAIFRESLPVESHIAPVADNNPPGLPISYVRSKDIDESIFNVVGLYQLNQPNVQLAFEIPGPYPVGTEIVDNPSYYYFIEKAAEIANTNILDIETLVIDEDVLTNTLIEKKYAVTQDLDFGMAENFNLILVSAELNNVTPTQDIYRQIFISWRPEYYDGLALVKCGSGSNPGPNYSEATTFFDPNNHVNETGTLFYLANKMPVYRKYIDGLETFKIII